MKFHYSKRFARSYKSAPLRIKKAFDKQARLLVSNFYHPSLHTKKYDEALGIWQVRVNGGWRFYFITKGDTYHLIDIIPHPKQG